MPAPDENAPRTKTRRILSAVVFAGQAALLLGLGALGVMLLIPDDEPGAGPPSPGPGAAAPADSGIPGTSNPSGPASPPAGQADKAKKRGIEIRTAGPAGKPVAGAEVWCQQKKGTGAFVVWDTFRKVRTGFGGLALFGSLPPGEYRMLAFDGCDVVERLISVPESDGELKLDFTFRNKAVIRGSVRDPEGRPLCGSLVKAVFLDRNLTEWPEEFRTEADAFADEKGAWTIECVPPGRVTIKASLEERITLTIAGLEVAEGSDQTLELVLEPCAVVEGIVTLGGGAKPSDCGLYACCLFISRADGMVSTQTTTVMVSDEDGEFRFEVDSFDCAAVLFLSAAGFRPVWVPLMLGKGDRKRVEIAMKEKGGVLKGRIVMPEGKDVEVLQIKVRKFYASEKEEYEDDRIWDPIDLEADGDGRFSCDCLDRCACKVTVVLMKPNGSTWETEKVFTPDVEDMLIEPPEDW